MPGDFENVSTVTADRWFKHGIAEATGDKKAPKLESEEMILEAETQELTEEEQIASENTVASLKATLTEAGERLPHKINKSKLVDMVVALRARADEGADDASDKGGEE